MRVMEVKQCAICERTLLVGERPFRFAPGRGGRVRRGLRALPGDRARPRLGARGQPGRARRRSVRAAGAAAQPRRHLRRKRQAGRGDDRLRARSCGASRPTSTRCSRPRQLFNTSDGMRTVDGISRSLGEPQASIVVLSGAELRRSWSRSRGTSPGTSTGSSADASSPFAWPSAGSSPGEIEPSSRSGMPVSSPGQAFSRNSKPGPLDSDRLHSYNEIVGWEANDLLRDSA